ncbi:MAG: VOC family protein [Phycisphaerae bacterium]
MQDAPLISGLHHDTAIAADARRTVDFYAGVLGLKLVKVTVNKVDPTALHLYTGDAAGSPGSMVTLWLRSSSTLKPNTAG